MTAEEDNFDIDIYGDGGEEYPDVNQAVDEHHGKEVKVENEVENEVAVAPSTEEHGHDDNETREDNQQEYAEQAMEQVQDPIPVPDTSLPKPPPPVHGLKRKESPDDRPVEAGATTALFISEIHWWITDDDLRGWANQSNSEGELQEITFNEQKVNGKSKGQAYMLFKSPQAATAVKQLIDSFTESGKYKIKFTVTFSNPHNNPFKTVPKDGPMRNTGGGNRSASGGYSNAGSVSAPQQGTYNTGGFRGGRGNFNRGGQANAGGYNNNRGGFQQPTPGSFQANPMNNFQGGGGANYGNYNNNRGGMMGGMRGNSFAGMRGGRGGMPNMGMGMPMGGMNMGGMPGMAMGMPQMGAGMGMPGMQGMQGYSTFALYPPSTVAQVAPATYTSPLAAPGYISPYSDFASSMAYGHGLVQGNTASGGSPPYNFSSADTMSPVHSNSPGGSRGRPDSMLNRASYLGAGGFAAQGPYNAGYFQGAQGGADASWNPHGAKRTRQE